jgi:subtilisin family serine protease
MLVETLCLSFILAIFRLIYKRYYTEVGHLSWIHKFKDVPRDEALKQMAQIRELLNVNVFHNQRIFGNGVKVGLLDDGCTEHQDLKLKLDCPTRGQCPHGTHISGIINNLAPKASLYNFQIINTPNNTKYCLGVAIKKAIKANVDIINFSISRDQQYDLTPLSNALYFYGGTLVSIDFIYEELEKNGILIIVAAGNQYSVNDLQMNQKFSEFTESIDDKRCDFTQSPLARSKRSCWPITVTSCDINGRPSEFNSINKSVDCMSYGQNIISFSSGNNYIEMSGTSMAVPQVVGSLALIIEYYKIREPLMNKIQRNRKARAFLLHHSTYRDLESIQDHFKLPEIFTIIDDLILSYSQGADQYTRSEVKIKIDGEITKLFASKILTNNHQFALNNASLTSTEESIITYQELKASLLYKYMSLSFGYGMVKFTSLPTPVITEKSNFC